jgi:CheY-like chemotaxis protein
MIVDDEPDQIIAVKQTLESLDDEYDVVGAESGEKCFEFLTDDDRPDLILLDIMMPEMSGWEVFDKLKEHPVWKDIPVVFLTARTDDLSRKAGGFLGEDYIEKPFEVRDLKERIDKILSESA